MSTCIYDANLYDDIYPKEQIEDNILKELIFVKQQIRDAINPIHINICGIEVNLDYDNKEIFIIA